ncbi:MAG: SUMF1/EgtB/PvdO family nonheme iron enzyme [Aestuariivirga sp.]
MLRTGIAVLVAALALGCSGNARDASFRAQMTPVALADGTVLQVSRHEVTVASWRQCFAEGGCSHMPVSASAADQLPVTGVNWFDVNEYLGWANGRAGGGLRLPKLAEWRFAARSFVREKPAPLFTDPRLAWAAAYGQEAAQSGPPKMVGSYTTTPEGISDLDGNVWEWTASCAKPGFEDGQCPAYVAAGEHEATISVFVRNPAAGGCATGTPPTHLGFRLVADGPEPST